MKSFKEYIVESKKSNSEEDTLQEMLRDSNLDKLASDIANQIMEPIYKYYETGDSKILYQDHFLTPREDFSFKKCMGDYTMEVDYILSNSGTALNDASETYMSIKVVNMNSRTYADNPEYYSKQILQRLKREVEDLVEHEMGHYYMRKGFDVGECLYHTQGISKYFTDPQEIVLHSKVIFNNFKRRYPDFKDMETSQIKEILLKLVKQLPYDTNAPRGAKFTVPIQNKYVNFIMKHFILSSPPPVIKLRGFERPH